ncbi:relaxase/mobilization nuclease domain-containing protein [Dysgonomonas sp. UBA7698]
MIFMVQLAKEYMKEMGIKNTQYINVRHHNMDNAH